MADVDFCVVGAGFAGLTAALRLKQAGQSVALLEARDRVGGRTFTEVRDDGVWIDRGGAWVGPGQDRINALMNEFGVPSYKQYTDGKAMMVVDGKQYRYRGTIPLSMSPWVVANLGAVFLELGQMCKTIPLEAPWEAKNADKWDRSRWRSGWPAHTASKPAHDLLETALAGCYTSAASEVSMLFALYQMASGGGPVRARGQGRRPGLADRRRHGRGLRADGRRDRRLAAPVAAGAADRPGRRRRNGALRRHGRAGAARNRCGSDRHSQPNPLRANASRRPVVSASANAERSHLQDQHRLRRAVLASRRPVRAVGRTGVTRDGHHRRVHRRAARRAFCA